MKSSVVTVTLNPAIDKTIAVDSLRVGELNRVKNVRTDPGGKGINVAKVLQRFGVDVIATGLIAGSQGRNLINYVHKENIKTDFLEIDGETRTNLKIVDEQTRITTEVNEAGFMVSEQTLKQFNIKLSELVSHSSILVLSGSLPPGVPRNIYRTYIESANKNGAITILDADGDTLLEGIKGLPFAVKPNIHELERLEGCTLDSEYKIVSAGRRLIDKGINTVIISMGSEGAIILNKDVILRAIPFPIVPQSTVGAGDSMVAALTYAMLNKQSIEEIARLTTTAGTITASKPGTQVCTLYEVLEALHQVHIKKL